MSGFILTEWVEKDPQTVFDALMDTELAVRMMPNITQMEQTTSGPVGIGTKFRETRVVNGKEAVQDLEVVMYHQPERYGVSAVQSGITVTYTYDLSESNGGTRIDLECVVETNGVKKLILPVVAGILKKEDGEHLKQLKAALEASVSEGK